MKKLAIIILNWNGIDLLRRLIPTVATHSISEDSDLIVADNGSSDDSCAWLAANHPEVKLLRFDENLGFAAGYNRAIADTRYPFTILLNSDVETTPDWWRPMLRYMEEHPDTGALQPKIHSFYNRDDFEYAGAAGGFLDNLGYPYCRGRVFDKVETDRGQYDGEAIDVAWASGAALMVRTEAYLSLDGLDPDFFAHMEEIDLCCRMIGAGWKVRAITDSIVYHMGGASLPKENPKKTYLNFRNNLLLLHKNLPVKRRRRILLLRRMADTLAFLMYVATGAWGDAKAVLRAHGDFRKMRKKYTSAPATDYMRDIPGARRSIIIDHYLLRKL